jgi:cardiolipin synthase (CMP-forming)
MTLPNLLTLARILAIPFFAISLWYGHHGKACTIFALAALTDLLDGFIARRFDMRSELGAYLDPLADKALLMSIYVTLAIEGTMPGWLAIVVVSRDVMIMGAVVLSWLMDKPVKIHPSFLSKVNTVGQIAFAGLVLGSHAFNIEDSVYLPQMMLVVAGLTVASMGAYLGRWLRHMTG